MIETIITDEIASNLNKDNVIAFSYALNGACGMPNQIQIITNVHDNIFTFMSYDEHAKEYINKLIPCLNDIKFLLTSVKNLNQDWIHYDMGLGNYLFVHMSVNQQFKEKVKGLMPHEIYKHWHELIKD